MGRVSKKPSSPPTTSTSLEILAEPPANLRARPLVFISHDTRDADIAEAFGNLLTDASGGVLRSFRSSDRKGTSGIEFGAEWYGAIMERLSDATDVVALLTSHSINRPWILYEAGVAKGRLNTVVFGVAIGVPLEKAGVGPFAQFQNSGNDEDSLTKLVLQLIRRNPDANPREEAVRRQVVAFRATTDGILKQRAKVAPATPAPEIDGSAVARLFEEVKVMFRQLPQQVELTLESSSHRALPTRRRKIPPALIEELLFSARATDPEDRGVNWLIAVSLLRDEMPWLYDIVLEIYRAGLRGDRRTARRASHALERELHSGRYHFLVEQLMTRDSDRSTAMLLRHLPDLLSHFVSRLPSEQALRTAPRPDQTPKGKGEAAP